MKRILAYTALGISAVLLLIALNASQRRTAAAELALAESTIAAAAQAAGEMEALSLSMDKLLVTTSLRQTARLLAQISLHADRVQVSLSGLPDTQGQLAAVLGFLSRLSQLCQSALADLAEGIPIDVATRQTLTGMQPGLRLLHAEISLAGNEIMTGADADALPASQVTKPPTAMELNRYQALPSRQIGSGEAMQIAKAFVGEDKVLSVEHAPDTAGALPAFGITIQTADLQLNLEITRQGGKVLLMAPETAAFVPRYSPAQCAEAALAFLDSRGFAAMEAPYYQVYDGLCVLTCVNVQNGVLIWPDRVMVQVRMDTAEVVGLEARSYWKNHIPRRLQTPLLTQAEAQASLSPEVTTEDARLCLLPYQEQERLCWQFTITRDEETYLSYIDAITGSELLLEKLMQLESGQVAA